MDDLDRLYFEFVEITRRERRAALTEGLTVQELHDELIPYRRVRDPADLRSNDDYELALSRMLAGERGYLASDGAMQEEVRAGLEETLPDFRRYRAFPDVRVRLNPDKIPPPGHTRYAPPELRTRTEWSAPLASHEATTPDAETEETTIAEELTAEDRSDEADLDDVVLGESELEGLAGVETAAHDGEPPRVGGIHETSPGQAEAEEPMPVSQPASGLEICPQCGHDLPVEAAFCPFCGARLSPETCQACGAEVESAWRFCAACGSPRSGSSADPA